MTARIPWNQHEAVLLIDTCVKVREGKLSRSQAVSMLSIILRAYGEVTLDSIDKTYRNTNGINMRMLEIERIFNDGKGGLKNTSKLFVDTMAIYKTDKGQFLRMLEEARTAMGLNESNKQLFLGWLTAQPAQNILPEDICATLDKVAKFAKEHHLSEKSLWQIENCSEYTDFCRHIFDSRMFHLLHGKLANDFERVYSLYSLFLAQKSKSESSANISETTTIVPEETIDDSVETSVKQPLKDFLTLEDKTYMSLKSISDSNPYGTTSYYLAKILNIPRKNDIERLLAKVHWANRKYGTYMFNYDAVLGEKKYDFENPQSLAFTKPISLTYFDETTLKASSWRQLYVDFLGVLYEDYPTCLERFEGQTANGATIPLVADKNGSEQMRKPYEFAKGLYVETNRSASDIMSNLKKILDACNVDYDNVVVIYEERKNEVAQPQTEPVQSESIAKKTTTAPLEDNTKQKNEKITIIQAISIILQNSESPLTVKEIYDRVIEKDLYVFKAANPVNVVNTTINAACRGSNYQYRSTQDIFGFTKEGEEKKYFLLSREGELFPKEEKTVQTEPPSPFVRTDTDRQLSQKYPLLFKRVYMALNFYSGIKVPASDVHRKVGSIARLSTIKHILDYASWSEVFDDGMYRFSEEIIARTLPDENNDSRKDALAEENKFYRWLEVSKKLSPSDCGKYSSGLNVLSRFLEQEIGIKISFYTIRASKDVKDYYTSLETHPKISELAENQRERLLRSIQLYIEYLESIENTNNAPTVSSETNSNAKNDDSSSSRLQTLDFDNIGDLSFTKPFSLSYSGKEYFFAKWSSLYAKVAALLAADYPQIIVKGLSFPGSSQVEVSSNYYSLRSPKQISNGLYIETNHSATAIASKVQILLQLCGVNPSEIKITYDSSRKGSDNISARVIDTVSTPVRASLPIAEIMSCLKEAMQGITIDELLNKFALRKQKTLKDALANEDKVILINDKYYHIDNIEDFDETADIILSVIQNLFREYGGYTSAKLLFDALKARLEDFFFDNNGEFESAVEIYDIARYLFEKTSYKGNSYVFYDNKHIWESEPDYPKTYLGIISNWARQSNGLMSRDDMLECFSNIGSGSPSATFSWMMLNEGQNPKEKTFLMYDEYRFVLTEEVNIDETFLASLRMRLEELFDGDDYLSFDDIDDYFYTTLPSLPNGVIWTPYMIKSVLAFYDVGFTTIPAAADNDIKTPDAVVVRKNSNYKTFSDVLWAEINHDYELPRDFSSEEFRDILLRKGYIHGMERAYTVHNTVQGDLRFLWTNNNSRVTVSRK